MKKHNSHSGTTRFLLFLTPLLITIPATASEAAPLFDGDLNVHGDLSLTHDTNIFANDNEHSDWILAARPSLQYLQATGLLNLDLTGGVEIHRFDKFEGQDTEDFFASLMFSYPNRPGATRAQAEGGVGWKQITAVDETLGERIESEEWRVHGDVRVDHNERFATRAGLEYSERRYDESRFSRRDQGVLSGGGLWVYSEKLEFTADYRFRDTRNRGSTGRQSLHTRDHRFLIGAEGQLYPKVSGRVGVGLQHRNFREPSDGSDLTEPSFAAALQWDATDTTEVRLDGEQDFRITPDDRSVEEYTAALTVRQRIHERAHLLAGVNYGHLRFADTPDGHRDDDRYGANIGLETTFNHGITGSVTYHMLESDSNQARFDYQRHILEASLSASF